MFVEEARSLMQQHIIVVGAGAWGLPAAFQLRERGYRVTLIERFDAGNPYASSGGSTRLWRLADTQAWRMEAMQTGIAAMERLGARLGNPVFRRTGLLWRDDLSLPQVRAALDALGQPYEVVASENVGEVFPGLRPDGRAGIFVEEAGVVHADVLLRATRQAFIAAGGKYLPHTRVTRIDAHPTHADVRLADGEVVSADQVLVTAGPGTTELLEGLGLRLPLQPYIEQVVYVGDPGLTPPAPDLPGFVDCPTSDEPGIYAMPNGDAGYKLGLDLPLRTLDHGTLGDDLDRSARAERTEQLRARVARDLTALTPRVLATQVCTWTDSGDGDFTIGRVHPSVVLACGDSGEGFKYSAFMGEYLADLIEEVRPDPVLRHHWRPERFAFSEPRAHVDAIGRH